MKITDAKLSSDSTLVSLCKLLSFDESEPLSRECRRGFWSSAPLMLLLLLQLGLLVQLLANGVFEQLQHPVHGVVSRPF